MRSQREAAHGLAHACRIGQGAKLRLPLALDLRAGGREAAQGHILTRGGGGNEQQQGDWQQRMHPQVAVVAAAGAVALATQLNMLISDLSCARWKQRNPCAAR